MRIGSLFSGAAGLDRAVAEVFGGEVAWFSEVDPAASRVLAHHFPTVPNLGDITQVDWVDVPAVDVLCGGFPCQDVSAAGKRAGIKDGTRSGLWSVFAEAIDALRPRWVVIENVRGLLSADGEPYPPEVLAAQAEWEKWSRVAGLISRKLNRAQRKGNWDNEYIRQKRYEAARVARLEQRALARFRALRSRLVQRAIGTVIAELSRIGYDAQWSVVSAASIGAPHRRERVFILAADTTRQPRSIDNRKRCTPLVPFGTTPIVRRGRC